MKRLVEDMRKALSVDNFNQFYKKNLEFHDTYIQLCGNRSLEKIVDTFKKRLYDFSSPDRWLKEWEETSLNEHEAVVLLLEEGKIEEAAAYVRDVHWSFTQQENFIREYYLEDDNQDEPKE